MTAPSLAAIGLDGPSHRAAIWWLGVLYRRPRELIDGLKGLPSRVALRAAALLWLHALPYIVLISTMAHFLIVALDWPTAMARSGFWEFSVVHGLRIALGLASGIALGIDSSIASGLASGLALGIALGTSLLRIYYHPVHLFFVWPVPRGHWYPHHPVAWDDLCGVPFPGLDRLLVAYAETDPAGAQLEIERLISHYPSQRQAALRARTRLLVREAGRQEVLSTLDVALGGLPEGDKGFLAQTRAVRDGVGEIAAIQRRVDTLDRPFFREPFAGQLVKTMENFRDRVGGLHEPLASELRRAATILGGGIGSDFLQA